LWTADGQPGKKRDHELVSIEIAGRRIGEDCLPFIVAEAGINHEGEFDKAIQLVDAAVAAGADCVKFQCHITEAEMIPTVIRPEGISTESLWDIIKRCELTEAEERSLKNYCEKSGIIYLCTPFSREAADRLAAMDIPAFKIGSGELNALPLIEHIAKMGKPMIVSTGMNGLKDIAQTVDLIRSHNIPLALLHCTSMYPTAFEDVRLNAITELAKAFAVPIGFSDHSPGIYAPLGAVALGACIIEKHFTISRSWPGPDNPMSLEPSDLAELVKGAKAVFKSKGGSKAALAGEQPVIDFAFASVVTLKEIGTGERFTLDNTWIKRPGTGPIHGRELDRVLNKRASRPIPANVAVDPKDIDNWGIRDS